MTPTPYRWLCFFLGGILEGYPLGDAMRSGCGSEGWCAQECTQAVHGMLVAAWLVELWMMSGGG